MELTKELIKFCCKNLVQLDHLRDSDDWDIHRRADSRMKVFCFGMRTRLKKLGLPNPSDIARFGKPSLDELEQALRAMKALADAGSVDALEELSNLAMIAAKGVRNVHRMVYTRDHHSDIPWHKKPADQFGVVRAPSSPEEIKDTDVNKMLEGLDKRIASSKPAGQEQEGMNA